MSPLFYLSWIFKFIISDFQVLFVHFVFNITPSILCHNQRSWHFQVCLLSSFKALVSLGRSLNDQLTFTSSVNDSVGKGPEHGFLSFFESKFLQINSDLKKKKTDYDVGSIVWYLLFGQKAWIWIINLWLAIWHFVSGSWVCRVVSESIKFSM